MQCISVVMKFEYKFVLVPQVPEKCQKRPTLTQPSKDRTHLLPSHQPGFKFWYPVYIACLRFQIAIWPKERKSSKLNWVKWKQSGSSLLSNGSSFLVLLLVQTTCAACSVCSYVVQHSTTRWSMLSISKSFFLLHSLYCTLHESTNSSKQFPNCWNQNQNWMELLLWLSQHSDSAHNY